MIEIAKTKIGKDHPPFIVAEMSGNHNQSLERALKIVESAARTGVQALKLQTYTADTMTLDISEGEFYIEDKNNLWRGNSLYNLYKLAHTPWGWHKPIFDKCKEFGLVAFSTPFDTDAVDFLEELQVPCYKIASFENIDLPLIKKIAKTGKPVIMSSGMATIGELDEAVTTLKENGCNDIVILKCTSTYPASPDESNIFTIPHLRELFGCEVGLSDHTHGIGVAVASIALGATIIEKHFTLSRTDGGVDSAFSMEPDEMRALVIETKTAWESLGTIKYGPTEKEKKSQQYRRSLYVAEDMNAGDVFTPKNLRVIRPALGLSPGYYDLILGKKVKMNVKKGTPVKWDMLIE